jgi:hypothetical protein
MSELESLSKKVDRILSYIESDSATKQEGLVEKVNRIDKEVDSLLMREKVYLAKFTSAAFVGGAFFTALWAGIKLLFKF